METPTSTSPPFMSEQQHSVDPVLTALEYEQKLARDLELRTDKSRKDVRATMESWKHLMQDKKVRTEYAEQLGDLDPAVPERELLVSIHNVFPKIAMELGYTKDMELPAVDMNEQVEEEHRQAA